ncbi:hypothetical protein CPB84DRAFT_581475 [Gymnopilus junonius]|nr:hypothetical protein CPB84DRAFT_581475 [Gymnopilus junonius]
MKRSTIEVLLPRQVTTSSCSATCTPFQSALNSCTTTACFCTTAIANSLQQCVNCALEGNTDATMLNAAEQLVSDFELVCGTFPIPSVTINTASGPSSTPLSATNTASHSGSLPSTSLTTSDLATSTVMTPDVPFTLPTTIQQITIGPSGNSGASTTATSPSTSSTGTITFGGLTSRGSRGGIVDFVLVTMCGVLGILSFSDLRRLQFVRMSTSVPLQGFILYSFHNALALSSGFQGDYKVHGICG